MGIDFQAVAKMVFLGKMRKNLLKNWSSPAVGIWLGSGYKKTL